LVKTPGHKKAACEETIHATNRHGSTYESHNVGQDSHKQAGEVPTTPIEDFPQAIVILPIEAFTTPVDTFAQTDELLPIEVSTTPVSSLYPKQTKFCPLPLGAIITALV
jgi:hypothetical protein